jgi:uncharacterized protein (DUF1330 family)
MPAYVIASVRSALTTEEAAKALAEYRRRNTDQVAAHGGRFLVRGGDVEVLEGGWDPLRVVVMAFPDRAAARAWYDAPEYAELRALRRRVSDTDIILVEGHVG